MKHTFTFSTHIVRKYSLTHSLLSALIGGDHKVAWLEIFLKVISEVQILAILITTPYQFLGPASTDPFAKFFQLFATWITFREFFDVSSNSSQSNICLGVILAYFVILIGFIVAFIIAFYLKKTLHILALKIWINVSVVHYTCLFLVIHQFSIAILRGALHDQVFLLGTTSSSFFTALSLVIIIFNVLFAIAMARFVYDPIKSQYIAAVRSTIPDLLALVFKGIDVIILVFITDKSVQKYVLVVYMLILLAYRLKIYLTVCPYYQYGPMQLFQAFNFVEFGVALLNILLILINQGKEISRSSLIYMIVIISCFFVKLSNVCFEIMVRRYGLKNVDEIVDKDYFYKKLLAVDYILENGSISAQMEKRARENFTEFLYYGIVKAHKNKCRRGICGCNLILEKGPLSDALPVKEDQREIMRDFQFTVIQELFESFKQPEVKITLANFLFENKVDSYAAAITIIHSLKLDQGSTELKVVSAKLLEKIEKKVLGNYESKIDVQKVVDYQHLSFSLRKGVEDNILKYLKFWEVYKAADPNVRELYNLSVKTNREADKLAQIWENITSNYSRLSFRDHLLYGLYQSLTRACPYSAEKTLQKYFSLSLLYTIQKNNDIILTASNVSDPQNVIIYISMLRESLGHIAFSTRNVEDFLGYSTIEIQERNVNELMPRFYRERHNKILRAHVEFNRTTIVNRNRQVYPRKKNGYITPATLYVSIFPYFQKQLLYFGVLRPITTYDEFILVLPDGTIDSYSQTVAKLLNLNIESKRKIRLKYICPELDNFHKAFNYLITRQYTKLRQLSFSRRDFSSVSMKGRNSQGQTRSMNEQSNTSFAQSELEATKTQDMGKDSLEWSRLYDTKDFKFKQDDAEELADENEFEDWRRIYEIFTSTGIPIKFNKYEGLDRVKKPLASSQLEFTTLIIEESVLESHLRVFRLQTISVNTEAGHEEDSFQADERGNTLVGDSESPSRSDASSNKSENNLALRGKVTKLANVMKPFEALGSKNMNSSLGAGEEQAKLKSDLLEISANFDDLSEDKGTFLQNDDTLSLKNPFSSANPFDNMTISNLKGKIKGKFDSESNVIKGSEMNLLTEPESPFQRRHETFQPINPGDGGKSKGVFLMIEPTLQREISDQNIREDIDGPSKALKLDSSDEIQFNEDNKSQGKADLRKFFEEHKIMHADQTKITGERSSAQSSAQTARINSKIEKAIYTTQVDKTIKTMNWIVLLYCLASIILLIYDQIITNSNLNRLKANIQVQKSSTQRLFLILEINRQAQLLSVIEKGLAPQARQTADDTLASLNNLLTLGNGLNSYNNDIRLSINTIDFSEQPRFYANIPVKERGDLETTKLMNTFDACTEIINSAIQLNSLLPDRPASDNLDLEFILSNTLNSLVVKNEEVASILLDDNNISLKQVETTILILLIVIVTVAILIFLMVMRSEIKFISRKVVFLESFFRIKNYEIEENIFIVDAFHTSLIESDREDLFMQKVADDNMSLSQKRIEPKKNQRDFKAKSSNTKALNTRSYINLLMVFLFIAAFIIVFGVLFITFFNYKGLINQLMVRSVNTNINMLQVGLVLTSLYEYIALDGTTTIKNQPINTEWESIYQSLTESVDFFTSFDDQKNTYNQEILLLINGDLCPKYFSDRDCYNEDTGIGSRGILSINGFIMKGLREVKDYYDSSNHNAQAKTAALTMNDYLAIETAYSVYAKKSYLELGNSLASQFFAEISKFKSSSLIIGVVGIIGLVLLVCFLWVRIMGKMENERVFFRGMMRMIPVSVILGNRYLKNYLISTSHEILDSIKNRI